jgi:hypothetical protein
MKLTEKEGRRMAVPEWADRKHVEDDLVICGRAFETSWYVGAVFLLLGVISDAGKVNLGLAPTSWFLLVVATLLAAIIFRMGWAVAWYLKTSK